MVVALVRIALTTHTFSGYCSTTELQGLPAIDLLNGKCVRLNQGNYNEVTKFNSDPVKQAQIWESKGAKRLHLVDLDGAKTGEPINNLTIKEIKKSIKNDIDKDGSIFNQNWECTTNYLDFDRKIIRKFLNK